MDMLKGEFADRDADLDQAQAFNQADDAAGSEAPPVALGQDERRMQVRAYNHWTTLLGSRNFPAVDDLDLESLTDFGPHSVLLDFTKGLENPGVAFLGDKLAAECDAAGEIATLADIPSRSLLSRITDHYMQILANQAPIGFEAEFVNQRGKTILYRGILLPFSSDDESIDFIYGVINWKELADEQTGDELMLQIEQALEEEPASAPKLPRSTPITEWADGPASDSPLGDAAADTDYDEDPVIEEFEPGEPGLPRPHFGFDEAGHAIVPPAANDALEAMELPEIDEDELGLGDLLSLARDFAAEARSGEQRTRIALYNAISRAFDFSLVAASEQEDYRELLGASGLTAQDRAPMTPIVKLVFGSDYDKTRLTEYGAALAHGHRLGLQRGQLGDLLQNTDGGLKALVQTERRLRREESGAAPGKAEARQERTARKLRRIEPKPFEALPRDGEEFSLVMIRRLDNGELVVLGEIGEDRSLIEKAAKKLLA